MTATAKLKYLRIAPRKVRMVADMIRGREVREAKALLKFTVNRSAKPVLKLLISAVANAKNEFSWNESNLYISKITVDEGPKLKRWMPRARGSASMIQKKTSHIKISLDEIKKGEEKDVKKIKKKISTKTVSSPSDIKEEVSAKNGKAKVRPKKEEGLRPLAEKGSKKIFRRKSI